MALGLTPERPVTREVGRPAEEKQRPISAAVKEEDEDDCVGKVKSELAVIGPLQKSGRWGNYATKCNFGKYRLLCDRRNILQTGSQASYS